MCCSRHDQTYHAAEPTFNLNSEDGPIVGDTFATLVFYEKKKLGLALFYLHALT